MTAPTATLALPEHMQHWAQLNAPLLDRLQKRLDLRQALHIDDLWHMIADHASSEWRHAKQALNEAQTVLADRTSIYNRPLGAIGYGLDGGETPEIQNEHSEALAYFTAIDEQLRMRPELKTVLTAAKQALGIIATAEHHSKLAALANKQFKKVIQPMDHQKPATSQFLGEDFNYNNRRNDGPSPWALIQQGLRQLARMVMDEPAPELQVQPVAQTTQKITPSRPFMGPKPPGR